uniref:PPM-type phosphatase domain-containing protein n=1 Tax=Arcella intermedia TaxID=1963864 RepID=A0A6B2L9W4_9EUKA
MGLFGVYDGHGGDSVSTYVKENLHVNFLNQKKLISSGNIQEALKKGFVETDKQLYELCKEHNDRSGSTAVFAVLESNKIWVAWTGDTRAVLCSGYKAVELTNDHTPHNFNEKGRVIQAGGWISNNGCSRVNGLLAVTRALGDFYLKEPVEYVTAVPEITEREISPFDQFIIIASDGFWDVFGSQEAVDKIVTCKNPYTIAEEVVLNAIDRGSRDNITVLLIWFDWKMDLAPLVSQFEATSKKKDKGSSEDTEERGRVVMSDRSERNSRSASPPTVGIFQRERTEKGTSSKKKKTLAKSTLMEKRKLSNSNLGSVKKSEEK